MRLALLFSDLHCNNKQLQNLYDFVIQNKEIDALVFAGDVVNMGEPVWFMEKFIKVIEGLNRPFLWVPGNNDFGRAYFKLNAKYKSLEGRVVKFPPLPEGRLGGVGEGDGSNFIEPINFTGVGGSPASWAGQYEGESMIDKKAIAGSIFLSHVPPPGILVLQQKDVGSPNIHCNSGLDPESSDEILKPFGFAHGWQVQDDKPKRRFADSPLVHICGHLHYRWGTAYLGQTKVIQLASLETGHYAILDLETLEVKFKRF